MTQTTTTTANNALTAFLDKFGEYEDLDPELAAYLDDSDDFVSIRHPLVYSIVHFDALNARLNAQLRAKQEAVVQALAEEQWHHYVFLHERPWRVHAFDDIAALMDDADYWQLLGVIWIDSENIRQNPTEWHNLLRVDRPGREAIMRDDELEALAALPDTITVYQGHTGARDDGWSWTTERHVAEWFATRFASMEGDKPMLTTGTVDKADVVAYFTRRNEFEILVPREAVHGIITRKVKARR